MDGFLLLTFASLAALTAVLELFKRRSSKLDTTNREFLRFRANYVLVYALMMGRAPCFAPQHTLLADSACLSAFERPKRIPENAEEILDALVFAALRYCVAVGSSCCVCSWRLAARAICLCAVPVLWLR